jgi:acetyl-CoA synthetase
MSQNIESQLQEARVFAPPANFAAARVGSRREYDGIRRDATADPEACWPGVAEKLHWLRPRDTVLDWQAPFARWFEGKPGDTTTLEDCGVLALLRESEE